MKNYRRIASGFLLGLLLCPCTLHAGDALSAAASGDKSIPGKLPGGKSDLFIYSKTQLEKTLPHLPHDLQKLTVYPRTRLKETDFVYLKPLSDLRTLGFGPEFGVVTQRALQEIKELTKLEELGIGECSSIEPGAWDEIQRMPSLKILGLSGTYRNESLMGLEKLHSLQSLRLTGDSFDDQGLAYIRSLDSLTSLTLASSREGMKSRYTEAGLAHVGHLKGLRFLVIYRSNITDRGLAFLKDLKSLEGLELYETKVNGSGMGSLRNLSKLRKIHFNAGRRFGDEDIKNLGNNRFLEHFSIFNSKLSDEGIAEIAARWPGLKVLNLYRSPGVTDKALVSIENLKRLEILGLGGTKITDAGMAHIHDMPSLSFLGLSDTAVTKRGLTLIRSRLDSLPALKRIGWWGDRQEGIALFRGTKVAVEYY